MRDCSMTIGGALVMAVVMMKRRELAAAAVAAALQTSHLELRVARSQATQRRRHSMTQVHFWLMHEQPCMHDVHMLPASVITCSVTACPATHSLVGWLVGHQS
jgi:hypothetical protein